MTWIVQRTTGTANLVNGFVEATAKYRIRVTSGLAIVSLVVYLATLFSNKKVREMP